MSLNTQMKAFKRAFEAGAPPGVLGAFHRADMALRQTNILERALKAGEPMPEFTLPDAGTGRRAGGIPAPWSGRGELLSR
jgi:hypothetical protein